jgi:hypothetical protein
MYNTLQEVHLFHCSFKKALKITEMSQATDVNSKTFSMIIN